MVKHIAWGAVLVVIICSALQAWTFGGEDRDFSPALENMKLYVPEDRGLRSYLGLGKKNGQCSLRDIRADILIIEIFSMYCPHCQKHAPAANEFYQDIEGNSHLKDRVRMIGIGVGNSPYEVEIFRKKYSPPFPLFDDRDSAVVNTFGGILTPYYFALKKNADNTFEVFYSKSGGYTDAGKFLDMIVKLSGIQ